MSKTRSVRRTSAPSEIRGGEPKPDALLSDRFIQDVIADWEEHGAKAIASVRADRPQDYLKLITGLFPKDTTVKVDALDELTDEQLSARLAAVLARLAAAGTPAGGGSGSPETA